MAEETERKEGLEADLHRHEEPHHEASPEGGEPHGKLGSKLKGKKLPIILGVLGIVVTIYLYIRSKSSGSASTTAASSVPSTDTGTSTGSGGGGWSGGGYGGGNGNGNSSGSDNGSPATTPTSPVSPLIVFITGGGGPGSSPITTGPKGPTTTSGNAPAVSAAQKAAIATAASAKSITNIAAANNGISPSDLALAQAQATGTVAQSESAGVDKALMAQTVGQPLSAQAKALQTAPAGALNTKTTTTAKPAAKPVPVASTPKPPTISKTTLSKT